MSLHKSVIVILCRHDRSECPYAHNFQDYRRDPRMFNYAVLSFLLSLNSARIGISDKSNQSKTLGVLLKCHALRVMAGWRKSTTQMSRSLKETIMIRLKSNLLKKAPKVKKTQNKRNNQYLMIDIDGTVRCWSSFLQELGQDQRAKRTKG